MLNCVALAVSAFLTWRLTKVTFWWNRFYFILFTRSAGFLVENVQENRSFIVDKSTIHCCSYLFDLHSALSIFYSRIDQPLDWSAVQWFHSPSVYPHRCLSCFDDPCFSCEPSQLILPILSLTVIYEISQLLIPWLTMVRFAVFYWYQILTCAGLDFCQTRTQATHACFPWFRSYLFGSVGSYVCFQIIPLDFHPMDLLFNYG